LLAGGCRNQENIASASADVAGSIESIDLEAYDAFVEKVNRMPNHESYTCAVQSMYRFAFPNDTFDSYTMDAVMEQENASRVHLSSHLNANGMAIDSDAYYLDGRCYYDFDVISYYEDMTLSQLKESLLVPLKPATYAKDVLYSIVESKGELDKISYALTLNETNAAQYFVSRYDFYGVDQLDFKVESNEIVDEFDQDGNFIREHAVFNLVIHTDEMDVGVLFESTVSDLSFDQTIVSLDDGQMEKLKAYVNYKDLNPDDITPLTEDDDSLEETVAATFEKRLVSRLGYEKLRDGVYQTKYNDNESYTVDFNNCLFEYANYTIVYTYSWRANVGSMGACTVDFNNGIQSSSCQVETVDMIEKMETYLQMELYYCGLSLDALREETN